MNITVEGGKSKKLLTGGKYCPEDITVTAEAPVAVEEKDVNFYDYDGTCLYAYTIAEAQALTELPPGPTHEGLVFQEWNWALEDVKALDQFMVIGANYITDDGKTRLHITLVQGANLTVPLHIMQTVSAGVKIDWGDGSSIETISGTGAVNTTHSYSAPGNYVIKLAVTQGQLGLGNNNYTTPVGEFYGILRKVELGAGVVELGTGVFLKCYRLETISIPIAVKTFKTKFIMEAHSISCVVLPRGAKTSGTYIIYDCHSLVVVSFPKSQPGISNSSLRLCTALKYVAIHKDAGIVDGYGLNGSHALRRFDHPRENAIRNNSYSSCVSLVEFTVPDVVSEIQANALSNLSGLCVLRFLPATPPTVANANAFSGIPATCRVEVPAESLEAYQNATNYSGIAAQMVGV